MDSLSTWKNRQVFRNEVEFAQKLVTAAKILRFDTFRIFAMMHKKKAQ